MNTALLALLACLGCATTVGATERTDRSLLAAYGTAYCMSKIGTETLKAEANLAMGGYVQLSSYESEDAFQAVRKYVDGALPSPLPVYQTTGQPAALMICLDLTQKREYANLVRRQDRYLPRRMIGAQ